MAAGRWRPRRRRRAHLAGAAALAGVAQAFHVGRPVGAPPPRGSSLPLGFVTNPAVPRSLEPGRPLADWLPLEEVRLWSITDGFSYIVCAMMGVNFALACRGGAGGLAAAALRAPGGQAAFVAASAGLTSFGGSTQSTLLLRWLGQRFRATASVEAERRKFIWQDLWPHVWASLGVMLAVGLHLWTGRLLDGSWWRWAVALNSALFTVHAVGGSGWFTDGSPRCPLLRTVGAFLYLCGGGIWRDILGGKVPSALSINFLAPAGLGVLLCLQLQHPQRCSKTANEDEGVPAAALGVPAVTCLFAACA